MEEDINVLFFDTESTALDASWGRILCASFCGLEGEPWTFRKDVQPFRAKTRIDDSKLVVAIRDELEKADMIVGWNSILHDVPLLNARLASAGERSIQVGERYGIMNLDLMYYAGGQSMKLGSRSLANVSKFFGTSDEKTSLDGDTWQLAASGDHGAMDDIVVHCQQDILVLRELWPKLAPSVKKFQFTLSEIWPFIDQLASRKNK